METQFNQIIQLIQVSRSKTISAVNTELIHLYWQVGGYISQQLQETNWGEKTVGELAIFIKQHHPEIKGFDRRSLYRMRQFYDTYSDSTIVGSLMTQLQHTKNESNTIISPVVRHLQKSKNKNITIVSPVVTQLDSVLQKDCLLTKISWTHHLIIMSRCKTTEEKTFYIKLSIQEKYSVRELERQINSGVYERSVSGMQLSPSLKDRQSEITSIFKDSYVFEFLNLQESVLESELQKALIIQMKSFVLELGKDFLFVAEEFKLQVGSSDFYIDLLFYHRGLHCLIAFELKADKFKPEQLGQLNFYLEALDRDVKKEHENPSIGILLCKDKDCEVVEYALSRNLSPALVAEYKMKLPDKEILQKKLHDIFAANE